MAEGTQQHPLKIYFQVWILLFVFSAFSYMVDWYQFEGYLRWGLILFFMITGFHGTHVTIGVIFLFIMARKAWRGDFDTGRRGFFTSQKSNYEAIEIMGLYWHFVDLVWVFIFAFFYLW